MASQKRKGGKLIGDLSNLNPVIYNADQGTSRAGHRPKRTYIPSKPAATSSRMSASTSTTLEDPFLDATPIINEEVPVTVTQIELEDVGPGTSSTSVYSQINCRFALY